MKSEVKRSILTGTLVMLGIAIAYCGALIPGLLTGALAIYIMNVKDFHISSDDEESEEVDEL